MPRVSGKFTWASSNLRPLLARILLITKLHLLLYSTCSKIEMWPSYSNLKTSSFCHKLISIFTKVQACRTLSWLLTWFVGVPSTIWNCPSVHFLKKHHHMTLIVTLHSLASRSLLIKHCLLCLKLAIEWRTSTFTNVYSKADSQRSSQ